VFYVTFLGYVCLAIVVGLVILVFTLVAIIRRHEKDPRIILRQVASTPLILALTGAAWIVGLLGAKFGGLGLNVAFCIVNSVSGLTLLIDRCHMQRDFLSEFCLSSTSSADSSLDNGTVMSRRRRRRRSVDSLDSSGSHPGDAVVGRTVSSSRHDTHDVFAGSTIITPAAASHNGAGWGRARGSRRTPHSPPVQLKYGRPDVHADTLRRTEPEAVASPSAKIGSDVPQQVASGTNGSYRIITTTNVNNETLTYI
jgi:hypothetical protein